MNWAIAESEGFRRGGMVDDEEDEEHQRYLAHRAAEEAEEQRQGGGAPMPAGARPPVLAGLPVLDGLSAAGQVETVFHPRQFIEREEGARQAALGASASAARRRDAYFTNSVPQACASSEAAWEELRGGKADAAKATHKFLSDWGDVLR
jgi:hypothetical protein